MEKNVSSLKILNIVFCSIILLIFVIFGTSKVNAQENNQQDEVLPSIQINLGYKYKELLLDFEISEPKTNNIDKNIKYIEFYSKMFGYNSSEIIDEIKEDEILNSEHFEYDFIEYLYNLNKTNSELKRNIEYIPYTGEAEYIENLIIYFSQIYDNVDPVILLSIGAAESGYYKVQYMLRKNNIYGGMSQNGLIKYNNIEIGVLTYVRMMSRNYYGQGLTNIYSIGRKYCPVIENGTKQASNHWIYLVNNAKNKYKEYNKKITIEQII